MQNCKKFFRISLLLLSFLFLTNQTKAQTISSHFFGQNAWMPAVIGNTVLGGKLDQHWGDIKNSGAALIRFGGITPDKDMPTNAQYIKMIDSIRANGMEPTIQVPFNNNAYTPAQAAAIVNFINVTSGKNIKYWSIGNEPNLGYSYHTSSQVAAYYKSFATAMKNVDPTILIIGPEIAWFDQTIIDGLTNPGGPDDITGKDGSGHYYVDIISFHTYPFNGSQTRSQVVSKLTSAGSLQDNLIYLNSRIANCNSSHSRTGSAALKTAITEVNIDYQNSASDDLYGVGANSFIGGQFVAEMLCIGMKSGVDFMNIWSVIEGNSTALNIGYLDASTGRKKPLYYHFKLLADNFKGNFVTGTTNMADVKTFACQNGQQTAVLILNEDQGSSLNYTVRLNSAAVSGNNALKININAGLANEYSDVIAGQSTVLLLFNSAGTITGKYEYSLMGNAVANTPPTYTPFTTGVAAASETKHGGWFSIKVFPNPTNGKFTIQLSRENFEQKDFEIELYNMAGQRVLTKNSKFYKSREEIDLLTNSMANGMYVVRVRQDEDISTAKLILVK